jgi:FeS assembly protein IscX
MYYRRALRSEKVERLALVASDNSAKISLMISDNEPTLFWDSAYAIALALIDHYPDVEPENVGLNELALLVETLPGFRDDPLLANERILLDVQFAWYEERTPS